MRLKRWMAGSAMLAAGCASAMRSGPVERNAAVLQFYREPVVIEVPGSATAGQAFSVTIRTYGGGCVREGYTEVSVQGRTAQLRPRDMQSDSAEVCTAELRTFRHESRVTFDQPGRATVRIHGAQVTTGGEHRPLVVTRTVVVR